MTKLLLECLRVGKVTPGGVDWEVKVRIHGAVYRYVGSYYMADTFVHIYAHSEGRALQWLKHNCILWEKLDGYATARETSR